MRRLARAAGARIAIDRGNLIRLNMSHAFPLSCPDIEGLRRVRETKRGGWMRRFLSGALPFYALAGLAMCMYLVLYKTNLFDLNAIVQGATGSAWFPVFMFACVLLESVFPYFGYFPGTALILMSVALNPKPCGCLRFHRGVGGHHRGRRSELRTGSLFQADVAAGCLKSGNEPM
ncbi:hypothetical protein ACVW0J_002732 [Bradyrhizobium sp. i1.7.7]